MVKSLLTDRFKLRVRTETREMPIFELRLARSDGPGRNAYGERTAGFRGATTSPLDVTAASEEQTPRPASHTLYV